MERDIAAYLVPIRNVCINDTPNWSDSAKCIYSYFLKSETHYFTIYDIIVVTFTLALTFGHVQFTRDRDFGRTYEQNLTPQESLPFGVNSSR